MIWHLSNGSEASLRLQTTFCILAWVQCHNIPNPTPLGGCHKVTEATKKRCYHKDG